MATILVVWYSLPRLSFQSTAPIQLLKFVYVNFTSVNCELTMVKI